MEGSRETSSGKCSQNRFKGSPQAIEAEVKPSILSPNFRSAAAKAGWDEESLLLATLIVEDTPIRESRHKKRPLSGQNSSASTREKQKYRRARTKPSDPIPAITLCLDDIEEDSSNQEAVKVEKESGSSKPKEEKKDDTEKEGVSGEKECIKGLPCLDRLRDELTCAICLEICYEPSTTSCGHSFCKKCLKCSANKCGKRCPKCRQLISNGRSCTVNTVLWNTIQLLFPEAVEARKNEAAAAAGPSEKEVVSSSYGLNLENILRDRRRILHRNYRSSSNSISSSSNSISSTISGNGFRSAFEVLESGSGRFSSRRRLNSSQHIDAAIALRLQREEFYLSFRNSRGRSG